jgi:pilus assembly protein CpaC
MRIRILAIAAAALAALAVSASARTVPHVAADPAGAKLITVSAHGNGPMQEHITLALSKAAIVQLDTDARDVLVSDPTVVDAVVRTPRRIFLLGQKTGQTNAFFFDAAGHQILSIDIRVERDVTDLSAMIHTDLPNSSIHVAALNDNVVLTGNAQNAGDSTRAQDLAARFVGDPTKVANLLKISSNEQVMLKVRVAEVQRSIAKQFGINLSAATLAGGVPIIAATSNPYSLIGQALSASSGAQIGSVCPTAFIPGATPTCTSPNNLQGVLNALEQDGLVHTLAEPDMTAVSGETAKFLAGGEFPVPVSRDQFGNVTVEFKQFGVGLSFTPVVLSENRISLQISTEVSELTNTGAFTQAGGTSTPTTGGVATVTPSITIPALNVRRAETTVELPSGGSFAIAGLMQHVTKQQLDAFPGLKDMPVLGALFRSRDFENDETELVVIVSAYLVSPTNEKKFEIPNKGFVPASDMDTILMGKLNTVSHTDSSGIKSAGNTQTGFIVE